MVAVTTAASTIDIPVLQPEQFMVSAPEGFWLRCPTVCSWAIFNDGTMFVTDLLGEAQRHLQEAHR